MIASQLLYLSKKVRPDLLVAVALLTKRVLGPQQDDWNKLKRAIQYLRKTCHMGIEGGETVSMLAYADALFGVQPDMVPSLSLPYSPL